jgi:hypothetical protein
MVHYWNISIVCSECVSVALVIQHLMRVRRIILSAVASLAVPYLSVLSHKRHDFRIKVCEHKDCFFNFFYNFCLEHFSFDEELSEILSYMYLGLHVKYRYSRPVLMKFEFSRQVFEKYPNIQCHENQFSGSRVGPCGRTYIHMYCTYVQTWQSQ